MSIGNLKTLPEYKQMCEQFIPVYVDIIFSYLVEIKKYDYYSGKMLEETPIVNIGSEDGKIHGMEKFYYESGEIEYETPYINGKKHGLEKNIINLVK
jgi:antitoxin component YwqK of YwqJK toxin-antitoxin module